MHFRNWNILLDSVLKWFTGHRQDEERDGHKSEKLEGSIVNPAGWVYFLIYAEPLLMFPLHPLSSILRYSSSYWDPGFIWICAFWLSCGDIIICCSLLGVIFGLFFVMFTFSIFLVPHHPCLSSVCSSAMPRTLTPVFNFQQATCFLFSPPPQFKKSLRIDFSAD